MTASRWQPSFALTCAFWCFRELARCENIVINIFFSLRHSPDCLSLVELPPSVYLQNSHDLSYIANGTWNMEYIIFTLKASNCHDVWCIRKMFSLVFMSSYLSETLNPCPSPRTPASWAQPSEKMSPISPSSWWKRRRWKLLCYLFVPKHFGPFSGLHIW